MKTNDEVVVEHLREVGVVCSGWAHLEFLFEVTLCWLIGFLNRKAEGRVITSGLSLETLARKVCDLQHLKISDTKDRETLESVRERISLIVDERTLAVHGVRSADPEGDTITAELSRGKYKSKPQNLPLVRLRSLNVEIMLIITTIQPLLVRYDVIEGVTDELRPP